MLNDWSHKARAILIILPSLSQSAWNTRFNFGHQKPCMDNNMINCLMPNSDNQIFRNKLSMRQEFIWYTDRTWIFVLVSNILEIYIFSDSRQIISSFDLYQNFVQNIYLNKLMDKADQFTWFNIFHIINMPDISVMFFSGEGVNNANRLTYEILKIYILNRSLISVFQFIISVIKDLVLN